LRRRAALGYVAARTFQKIKKSSKTTKFIASKTEISPPSDSEDQQDQYQGLEDQQEKVSRRRRRRRTLNKRSKSKKN
jgi:hypothetical protein